MSVFLPEDSQGAPQSGVSSLTPEAPQSSREDIALMQRVLAAAAANPLAVPEGFWQAALEYIQVNRLTIPISQVFGFTQFTAQYTEIITSESTASNTYTDLTTIGPTLTLPDGRYIFVYAAGCFIASPGNAYAYLGLKYNTTEANDNEAAQQTGATNVNMELIAFSTAILNNNGNNVVQCRYRTNGTGAVSYYRRRLLALKYANL